ncbi:MAG: glycosyltransferase family 2 protein [Desulfobulbus sp.]
MEVVPENQKNVFRQVRSPLKSIGASFMRYKISVIIVNYNTSSTLDTCLSSLEKQRDSIHEVIVVDNASEDDSVTLVKQNFPWVELIESPKNLGFGVANNLAFSQSSGDLLFLLNPDGYAEPGCLNSIMSYMASHPDIGMAGTATFNIDGSKQPTVEDEYPGQRYSPNTFMRLPGNIAWLLGAGLVIRREVMEQVQGFDPDYFLYGEDIDLSLRIRKASWPLGYIEAARIQHVGGQSERTTPPEDLFTKKIKAELLFYRKHYSTKVVHRIARIRYLEACWRLFSLKMQDLLFGCNARDRLKKIKYGVARQLYSLPRPGADSDGGC